MAKKALAEGRERRVKAASDEKAGRVAAAKAAARKAENEEKAKRSRESIGQFCTEFDERWARIDEETRVANAAWAAGKEEREAAERAQRAEVRPRPMQVATPRPSEVRPQPRPPSPATSIPIRQAEPSPALTPISAAASMANRPASAPGQVRTTQAGQTAASSPEPSASSQTRPATRTSPPPDHARHPAQQHRSEPLRPVVQASTPAWAPPSVAWPPHSASTTTLALPSPGRAAATLAGVPESPRATLAVPGRALTGADLAAWRAARGLAQRPAADLLGVAPSTVAKAELLPGKLVGDQLQVALAAALGA